MKIKKRICQALLVVLGTIGLTGIAAYGMYRQESIHIVQEELRIEGLKQDYEFYFIADSHLSLCDERDAKLIEKAKKRKQAFFDESGKDAKKVFAKLITEANSEDTDLVIFAGDITDSAMWASIDYVQAQVDRLIPQSFYVLGNHDFEYGKQYFSKKAYKNYFPRLENLTGTSEQYVIKEYEDLVLVGLNDKNNQFDKKAVKRVLPILQGDKPVILVIHVPLQPLEQNSKLEQQANDVWGVDADGHCRVLLGESACKPDAHTQKVLDAVFSEDSPVAAVLAGHIHFFNHSMVNTDVKQVVTGAGYYGEAVRLHVSGM